MRYDITPVDLDASARQVTLDLDGTTILYSHGSPRLTQITWPGQNRMQSVRLVFEPPPVGGTGVLSASGRWVMFRLFDFGKLQQVGAAEKYTLTFTLGERKVVYEIRTGSVLNPLAPGIMQYFRCPNVQ